MSYFIRKNNSTEAMEKIIPIKSDASRMRKVIDQTQKWAVTLFSLSLLRAYIFLIALSF